MRTGSDSTGASEKKRRDKRLVWYVIIAVCLAVLVAVTVAIIFYFSEESKEASGDRSSQLSRMVVDYLFPNFDDLKPKEQVRLMNYMRVIVRKVAHFLEFALLGFLSGWLMLHFHRRKKRIKLWMTWLFPTLFCLVNAAFDEIHQIFSNRGPSVRDVGIDFAGAVFGLLLIQLIYGIICGIRCIVRHGAARRARKKAERDQPTVIDPAL